MDSRYLQGQRLTKKDDKESRDFEKNKFFENSSTDTSSLSSGT